MQGRRRWSQRRRFSWAADTDRLTRGGRPDPGQSLSQRLDRHGHVMGVGVKQSVVCAIQADMRAMNATGANMSFANFTAANMTQAQMAQAALAFATFHPTQQTTWVPPPVK